MKITSTGPLNPAAGTAGATTTAVDAADRAAGARASSPALQAAALESDVLKPAQAAMADMPDVDQTKVAALRDALAKGEIRFDANRLAQLIQRFHGGRS
ncbi:flagellar biosynthesis anti-sigma factor FlgM [Roseateles aquatilis]|uniref:Negative regulator of flagellin synthesis n=1 Tax=Roseateles aquatilis TaxID=431061 RepID=A0A246JMN6_9BURK|nr:flagellar biosynthesis anti-sigma factor FlgM [Roseateles aquatilis]OWQ93896.1 flagellar biosynthesis anti-sigma factor FlgM [Roseateles aquatilis]